MHPRRPPRDRRKMDVEAVFIHEYLLSPRRSVDKMTAAFAYGIRPAESPTKPQFASAVTQIADCHFDRLDASLRLVRADLRQEHNIARRQPRKAESIAKVEQSVFCHIDR